MRSAARKGVCVRAAASLGRHQEAGPTCEVPQAPTARLQAPEGPPGAPGPRLPLPPAAPQPDHSALQARVAAASREGAVGFPAGPSPRRGEEPRPPRGRERETSEGLLTGLSEKRQPRARRVLCKRRPVPALWVPDTRRQPPGGGRAGGACVREGNASRDPRLGRRRALRPPSAPLPGGGGARRRSVASSRLPRGFPRHRPRGPSSLRAVLPSPRRRKDPAFRALGLGGREGFLRNPGREPVARPGYLHWHTPPFWLPGRPQPWGRVLPVHPKCLLRSPRFGLWCRRGFCEPRRPGAPGSQTGRPPPALAVVPGSRLGTGAAEPSFQAPPPPDSRPPAPPPGQAAGFLRSRRRDSPPSCLQRPGWPQPLAVGPSPQSCISLSRSSRTTSPACLAKVPA
ncbi:uncharacterized protein [Canis lupus baileyi]|uniref:uncharacterized protein n=1 Tax=Canis lupus baileyi TaxID=143281 RepID=UPI003B96C447